jgi:hypothetical protein
MRHHIGCITYLRNDVIQFYWEDPVSDERKYIAESPKDPWAYYYAPAAALIRNGDLTKTQDRQVLRAIREADLSVGVHPEIERLLLEERWSDAKALCERIAEELTNSGYQPDGLRFVPGASWLERRE